MNWIFENDWALYGFIFLGILLALTLVAFVLAAFESEHYLNSPFRGGKKISFKRALRNYMVGLYMVVIILAASAYGVVKVFEILEPVMITIICIGVPLLAMVTAYMNCKNEKYMFLKIKEFIEGFLTIFTILTLVLGFIGYYITYFQ